MSDPKRRFSFQPFGNMLLACRRSTMYGDGLFDTFQCHRLGIFHSWYWFVPNCFQRKTTYWLLISTFILHRDGSCLHRYSYYLLPILFPIPSRVFPSFTVLDRPDRRLYKTSIDCCQACQALWIKEKLKCTAVSHFFIVPLGVALSSYCQVSIIVH